MFDAEQAHEAAYVDGEMVDAVDWIAAAMAAYAPDFTHDGVALSVERWDGRPPMWHARLRVRDAVLSAAASIPVLAVIRVARRMGTVLLDAEIKQLAFDIRHGDHRAYTQHARVHRHDALKSLMELCPEE